METVLTALAPVVVTLLLGFVAAWHHDFAAKDAAVLNRMILLYAVPVALFVGTVGTPRSELVQDVAFAVAMCAAIVGMYALVFLFFRLALRFSLGESVLAALAASAPAAPFMGPAVLGDLFGKASAVSIAIADIVINLVVVPITMLGLPLAKTPAASTAHPTERYSGFSEKLRETFKEPIVWAPLLAFARSVRRQNPSDSRPWTFAFKPCVGWRRDFHLRNHALPRTKSRSIGSSRCWCC